MGTGRSGKISAIPDYLYQYTNSCVPAEQSIISWVSSTLHQLINNYNAVCSQDSTAGVLLGHPDATSSGVPFLEDVTPIVNSANALGGNVIAWVSAAQKTDARVAVIGRAIEKAGTGAAQPSPAHLGQYSIQDPPPPAVFTVANEAKVTAELKHEEYDLWCPVADATNPICSETGAFQKNVSDDYNTVTPDNILDFEHWNEYRKYAQEISIAMMARRLPITHEFFQHYLDGTGNDLNFDSTTAYYTSTGFSSTVDNTVMQEIAKRGQGATTFDSGWNDYPPADVPTTAWKNYDWQNSVGHGFFRVTGQLQKDGTWHVRLQLTSYYQFRAGEDFYTHGYLVAKGADMRHLEQLGWAKNFREIGTGNLKYKADGLDVYPIPQPEPGPSLADPKDSAG